MPPGWLCIRTTGCVWLPPAELRREDPVDPELVAGAVGLPVLGVDRPVPDAHAAVVGQRHRGAVVGAVRRAEVARPSADEALLLGDRAVHLGGLGSRGQPRHVGMRPGVVAEQEALRGDGRTVDGPGVSLTPMSKNVAATPLSRRIDRIASVLAPGPSSKVSATVFPAPGAKCWTPGRGGRAADRRLGEDLRRGDGRGVDGQHLRRGPRSFGQRRAGGGWLGAACAVGVASASAITTATTTWRRPGRRRGRRAFICSPPVRWCGADGGLAASRRQDTSVHASDLPPERDR